MLTGDDRSGVVELCNRHSASIGAGIVAEYGNKDRIVGVGTMIGEKGELIIETDGGEVLSIMDPHAIREQETRI
jgi:hypothetical protein